MSSHNIVFSMSQVPAGYTVLPTTSVIKSNSDWTVDWGDGETSSCYYFETALPEHRYAKAGDYDITINGDIVSISSVDDQRCPIITNNMQGNPYLTGVSVVDEGSLVTEIGNYTFSKCVRLETIYLPNVKTIGESAFEDCFAIRTVGTSFADVETIAQESFKNCAWKQVPNLSFPSVKTISANAFEGCRHLTSLAFGKNLISIGDNAFRGCKHLESIKCDGMKPEVSDTSLSGVSNLCVITANDSQRTNWGAVEVLQGVPVEYYNDYADIFDYEAFEEENTGDEIIRILRYKGDATDVIVPSSIEGISVGEIGEYAFALKPDGNEWSACAAQNVVLPDSIYYIEGLAFFNNKNLISVTLPTRITQIRDQTFFGCSALEEVRIPSNVTGIGNGAFACCESLRKITFGANVEYIDADAFAYCICLESVIFPEKVNYIGGGAFANCQALQSVIFQSSSCPDSTATSVIITGGLPIGSTSAPSSSVSMAGPFYGCPNAQGYIPHALGSTGWDLWDEDAQGLPIAGRIDIGNNEYTHQGNKYSFALDDTLTLVSFDYSNNGHAQTFPAQIEGYPVTSIGPQAFDIGSSQFTYLEIPQSITNISSSAFAKAEYLEKITFKGDPPTVGRDAFKGVGSSCSINISADNSGIWEVPASGTWNGLPFTSESLFAHSYGVITKYRGTSDSVVKVPSKIEGYTVTSIADGAFQDNTSIQSVTLPSSITTIGNNAFKGCTRLQTISLPSGITEIGGYAFSETAITSMVFPSGLISVGSNVFENCKNLVSVSNVIFLNDCLFLGCSALREVSLGIDIQSIPDSCFAGCFSLQSISLPSSISNIGYESFRGCVSLKDISIPEWVFSIGTGAFRGCVALIKVKITSEGSNLFIFPRAFSGCSSLEKVEISSPEVNVSVNSNVFEDCISLKAIDFARITSIGDEAFKGCIALQSVDGAGLESVGAGAFEGCVSIKHISLPTAIKSIENYAFRGCDSLEVIHFQKTTAPTFRTNSFSGIPSTCVFFIEAGTLTGWDISYEDVDETRGTITFGGDSYPVSINPSSNGFTYTAINDKEVRIDSCSLWNNVIFPTYIGGKVVTIIGDDIFAGNTARSGVTISQLPRYLREIGGNAFSYLGVGGGVNETDIAYEFRIPKTVRKIGKRAFYGTYVDTIIFDGDKPELGAEVFVSNAGDPDIYVAPGTVGWAGKDIPVPYGSTDTIEIEHPWVGSSDTVLVHPGTP